MVDLTGVCYLTMRQIAGCRFGCMFLGLITARSPFALILHASAFTQVSERLVLFVWLK